MHRENLIQLTNKLYNLTLCFPKKEPLRYELRRVALEVLSQNPEQGCGRLGVLDCLFEVARAQKWVKTEELLNLQQEYSKLKEEIEKQEPDRAEKSIIEQQNIVNFSPAETAAQPLRIEPRPNNSLNDRQQKIVAILKERDDVQVGELKKLFPEVTKRTLRRDFKALVEQGLIERTGERNETFYRLKT